MDNTVEALKSNLWRCAPQTCWNQSFIRSLARSSFFCEIVLQLIIIRVSWAVETSIHGMLRSLTASTKCSSCRHLMNTLLCFALRWRGKRSFGIITRLITRYLPTAPYRNRMTQTFSPLFSDSARTHPLTLSLLSAKRRESCERLERFCYRVIARSSKFQFKIRRIKIQVALKH